MKLAILGGGVSGLVAAVRLARSHDLTVFEASSEPGGHARTVDVQHEGVTHPVDLGFVVYNETTYPLFSALLSDLGLATRASEMSFSVQDPAFDLEYNGHGLAEFFAQRRNLVRPMFWRLTRDILRFNRRAVADAADAAPDRTLGEYLDDEGYGAPFVRAYVLPMGAAIWSAPLETMRSVPLRFFVEFFRNHGLLGVDTHHVWRTVCGGSRRYVDAIRRVLGDRLRCGAPVDRVRRTDGGVEVRSRGAWERFDRVVFAMHADAALERLEDPTPEEREILAAFPFQTNEAVLHTDDTLLPRRPLARASWNFHAADDDFAPVRVTYDMSRLQGLPTVRPILHTLGAAERVNPSRILRRTRFRHPQFTAAGLAAQERHREIDGIDRIHFCGAYWRNGFHEDGAWSAVRVVEALAAWN